MGFIDSSKTDHAQDWPDTAAHKALEKEMYAEGWGAVVGSRVLLGIIVFLCLVIAWMAWRSSKTPHIDLSSIPIAVTVLSPGGEYIGTTMASAEMVNRADLVPGMIWRTVKAMREVVPSGDVMLENRAFVEKALDPDPLAEVARQITESPPEKLWTDKGQIRRPVRIGVIPHNKNSGKIWTVIWREEIRHPGQERPVSVAEIHANFTIRFDKPTDNEDVMQNPAGVRIVAFEWQMKPVSISENYSQR